AEKRTQPPTEQEMRFNAEREGYDVGAQRQAPEPPKTDGPALDWAKIGFGKASRDADWVEAGKKAD
ncbi:MAG: hypothetical protein LBL25_01210, partial [Oscillospiraceae bacterium]|nr:hypothetical protein [Oscillospiraceae bacterium]